MREYDQALEHYDKSLNIILRSLPSSHPSFARLYGDIGAVHEMNKDYKLTLSNYRKQADILRSTV